jgi:hypothetical protein
MNLQPSDTNTPRPMLRFGTQLLVFLIVLNMGALLGQVRLYQQSQHLKEELEKGRLSLLKDSIRIQALGDSLLRASRKAPADSLTVPKTQ